MLVMKCGGGVDICVGVGNGCNNSGESSDTFFSSVLKSHHNILPEHGQAVAVGGRLRVWSPRYCPQQRVGATLIRPGDSHAVVDW